jgi:ABC-2 type transport system ATP-binding protein
MIRARGLGRRFGEFVAVDDISLDIADGTLLALLGPNGAGKTTTVRMLAGLLAPSCGSARVGACDVVSDAAGVRARVGLVTDVPGLYEQMTPEAYLDFFGRLYGLDASVRTSRIDDLLGMFELSGRRRDRMVTFSRGMQQKVALARAMLHEPSVLFLDEPTAGLDPLAARGVRELILSMKHARRSIVLCTHDLDEAERLADQVAILHGGRIVALDTPARLRALASPQTLVKVTLAPPYPVSAPEGVVEFQTSDPTEANPEVIAELVSAGARIVSVTCHTRTLEDVYATAVNGESHPGNTAGRGADGFSGERTLLLGKEPSFRGADPPSREGTPVPRSGPSLRETDPPSGEGTPPPGSGPSFRGADPPPREETPVPGSGPSLRETDPPSGERTPLPGSGPSLLETDPPSVERTLPPSEGPSVANERAGFGLDLGTKPLPGELSALWLIARRAAVESLNDRLTRLMNVFFAFIAPITLLALVVRPAADLAPSTLTFYLLVIGMMPAVGAVGIAAGQFAGERERGVLTPMLASPASNLAIFGGKVLGSILPPVLYSLIAQLIYLGGVTVLLGPARLTQLPLSLTLAMLLLVPSATCFAAIVGTLVSSRVRTYNAAQQIAGILLIPLWAALFAVVFRLEEWGEVGLVLTVATIIVLDVALTRIAAATWRREEVLSQR